MSAIISITASKLLKPSAYFLAGVTIAVTVGVTITFSLASVPGDSISPGDPSISGSVGTVIPYLLVGLLLFCRRVQQGMPKVRDWMNKNGWLVNIIVYVDFILLRRA